MRHHVDGRKFGRNTPHRKAMFMNLANNVIQREQIVTTVQKAKEARRVIEKLITLAKGATEHQRRLAFARTRNKLIVEKLFSDLASRYKTRNGGYTRILKMSDRRQGDGAELAVLELVDRPEIDRRRKRAAGDSAEATVKVSGKKKASETAEIEDAEVKSVDKAKKKPAAKKSAAKK